MRRRLAFVLTLLVPCALAGLALTAPARPAESQRYVGKSSQGRAVELRATPRRNAIRRFRIQRDFACKRGSQRSSLTGQFQQVTTFLRVGRGGRFHGHRLVHGGGGSLVKRGMIYIRGKVGKNRTSGHLRETARLRDGSVCGTGRVDFSAAATPRR